MSRPCIDGHRYGCFLLFLLIYKKISRKKEKERSLEKRLERSIDGRIIIGGGVELHGLRATELQGYKVTGLQIEENKDESKCSKRTLQASAERW